MVDERSDVWKLPEPGQRLRDLESGGQSENDLDAVDRVRTEIREVLALVDLLRCDVGKDLGDGLVDRVAHRLFVGGHGLGYLSVSIRMPATASSRAVA